MHQALQRRTEAGPRQLQLQVRPSGGETIELHLVSVPSKSERIAELFRRLAAAPPAATAEEAKSLVDNTLNDVEDELTGIPFDASAWQTDGRLYPAQEDSRRPVAGRPEVVRYRHRSHYTYLGANGAIEITSLSQEVLFRKVGADGNYI